MEVDALCFLIWYIATPRIKSRLALIALGPRVYESRKMNYSSVIRRRIYLVPQPILPSLISSTRLILPIPSKNAWARGCNWYAAKRSETIMRKEIALDARAEHTCGRRVLADEDLQEKQRERRMNRAWVRTPQTLGAKEYLTNAIEIRNRMSWRQRWNSTYNSIRRTIKEMKWWALKVVLKKWEHG